jgi:exodeoxyribonuclease VII large subunit
VTSRRPAREERAASAAPSLFPDQMEEPRPSATPEKVPVTIPAPGERPATAISVGTLAAATRDVIEGSFPPVWVRGEVIGFKRHRSGHWYFTLRDDAAQVRCVVWATDVRRMLTAPDEGMAVLVRGQLTVYVAKSDVQLRVVALQGVGDGLQRKAFEETRARLAVDGLLRPERKRKLPAFPQRIAVVTSIDGAALQDIIAVVRRRHRLVEIVAVPATVQGESAPRSLLAALKKIARWGGGDVVIVGRGGGGREDLWAFNDERVARALAACPVPTIAAIGHEIDVTLCDLVADVRAPTPSAAAETAVPELEDVRMRVAAAGRALSAAGAEVVTHATRALSSVTTALASGAERFVERRRTSLESTTGRLHALSPLATLARGFAVISSETGATVTSAHALAAGDRFRVMLRDGRVAARAERVETDTPAGPGPGESS